MPQFDGQTILILGAIVFVVFMATTVMTVISKFYRRCGADEALVRTGRGGNKVVIGGGIVVYPILHQLLRVSLRSVKLSVERSGKNALVTADKIKANVTTELYIKVEPIQDDVLAAARSFGERNLDTHAIAELIEGKLTDALRSVAANQTFMSLHGKRKEFAEHIQSTLVEELKKNGLTLENVSITALAMVPVKDLDEHDVFDAEGLRAITESVQTNRQKTNQIQREKENQIHAQNVEARMRQLQLEQQQKQSEADQTRKVAEYASIQDAETAKAVFVQEQMKELAAYDKQQAVETARITAEKGQQVAEISRQRELEQKMIEKQKVLQAAEIDRQTALEAATIEKEKVVGASLVIKEQAIEVARIGKTIAVTQSEEAQARAAAAKALALAEEEQAKQAIVTVEATARANREKDIAVIEAEGQAQVKRALAEGEAGQARALADASVAQARGEGDRAKVAAEARAVAAIQEAEATVVLANALAHRGEAEARVRTLMLEAENSISAQLLMRDVVLRALDVMPDVARELMAPAKAITEIKVLQTNNTAFGGGGGAAGSNGSGALGNVMSPILKTVLEAGAAYPLLRELMTFAQVDGSKLQEKAKGLLGELSASELSTTEQPSEAAE
jgi:uncharacterized membrane protein YqiK